MGSNRDRLIRRLRDADRKGCFRAFHAILNESPDERDRHLNVHAKLIIADGRFIRIGSSNINNRSMGLDTECDLAVEATDDARRNVITGLRDRLLAEHLDTDEATFAHAVKEHGGLIAAIEALNTKPRDCTASRPKSFRARASRSREPRCSTPRNRSTSPCCAGC